MKKIALITYDRTPYRILQLNQYSKVFEITAYYNAVQLKNRAWNLPEPMFVEKKLNGIFKINNRYLINFGILKLIKTHEVVIMGGYDSPSSISVFLICKFLKKPYSILMDGISPKKKENKNSLKYFLKKFIIKNAHSIFANGSSARRYLVDEFKFNKDKIYNQYLAVDNNSVYLAKDVKLNNSIRKIFEGSNKYKLIYSGRLLEGKNVSIILDAINKMENKNEYTLIILGDGPERENLLQKSKLLEIDTKITGFIEEQNQLFAAYYYGDILILPSKDDAWGLVVNEAMSAGLPVLVSENTGSASDLVYEGINGYTFDYENSDELAEAIKKIYQIGEKKMGKESKKIIEKWNFQTSLESFINMINERYRG